MEPVTRLEKYLDQIMHNTGGGADRAPLVLYTDRAEEYDADPTWGDRALKAIQEGRQILVRVPNADGGNFTAIYSPVLTYQLPNYENDYLYLFYLKDEKQNLDLSAVGLGAIEMPTYGELQMKLSESYTGSPLGQPYINNSSTVYRSGSGKPVFFVSSAAASTVGALCYYDNPDRLATLEEVVDAYFAGTAYIFDKSCGAAEKIVGFSISSGNVIANFVDGHYALNNGYRVHGSAEADLAAAMAKYLP